MIKEQNGYAVNKIRVVILWGVSQGKQLMLVFYPIFFHEACMHLNTFVLSVSEPCAKATGIVILYCCVGVHAPK